MRASRSIHKKGGALESVTWRRGGGAGAGARNAVDVNVDLTVITKVRRHVLVRQLLGISSMDSGANMSSRYAVIG